MNIKINRAIILLFCTFSILSCSSNNNTPTPNSENYISSQKSILKNIAIKFPDYAHNTDIHKAVNFELGIGVLQDFNQSKKLYSALAKKGNLMAMVKMGEYYELGLGGEKNLDLAKNYYLQAANKNYSPAMNNLGLYNHIGSKKARNIKVAEYWYKKASDKGDTFSIINLAELEISKGNNVRNYHLTNQLHQSVLKYKIPRSLSRLGYNLRKGLGVKKNIKRGKKLSTKSYYWNSYCGDIRSDARRNSNIKGRKAIERTIYLYRYYTEICDFSAASYIKLYSTRIDNK